MKKILIIISILAFLGIADAGWLAYHSYGEIPLPCSVFEGCNEVAASPYSKVWGIPLSLFGVIFYAGVLVLSLIALWKPNALVLRLIQLGALVGFLLSGYFTYLQSFVINAFCIYCIASALLSTAIFILSFFLKSPSDQNKVAF